MNLQQLKAETNLLIEMTELHEEAVKHYTELRDNKPEYYNIDTKQYPIDLESYRELVESTRDNLARQCAIIGMNK